MPLSAATPEPVEIDEVFNTFDDPTRAAIQANLTEFGAALAGRGVSLNATIGDLRPLVERLQPVMRNLSSPETGPRRLRARPLRRRRGGGAGRRAGRASSSCPWSAPSARSPTSRAPTSRRPSPAPRRRRMPRSGRCLGSGRSS